MSKIIPTFSLFISTLLLLKLFAGESTALCICPCFLLEAAAGADTVLILGGEVLAELAHKAFLEHGAGIGAGTVDGNDHLGLCARHIKT